MYWDPDAEITWVDTQTAMAQPLTPNEERTIKWLECFGILSPRGAKWFASDRKTAREQYRHVSTRQDIRNGVLRSRDGKTEFCTLHVLDNRQIRYKLIIEYFLDLWIENGRPLEYSQDRIRIGKKDVYHLYVKDVRNTAQIPPNALIFVEDLRWIQGLGKGPWKATAPHLWAKGQVYDMLQGVEMSLDPPET